MTDVRTVCELIGACRDTPVHMIYVLYMLNVPVPAVRQAERLCAFKKKRFASVCRPVTRARGPPYSTSLPYGESLASRLSRYTKAERINNVKTTSKNDNEQNIHEPSDKDAPAARLPHST